MYACKQKYVLECVLGRCLLYPSCISDSKELRSVFSVCYVVDVLSMVLSVKVNLHPLQAACYISTYFLIRFSITFFSDIDLLLYFILY